LSSLKRVGTTGMALKSLVSLTALLALAIPTRAIIPQLPYYMESYVAPAEIQFPSPSGNCWTAVTNNDGAAVVLQPCEGLSSPSQSWVFSAGAPAGPETGGVGTIKVFGDKCLDVTDGVDASGTKLQIYGCSTGNAHQMWQLTTGSATVESVKWVNSTRCVDLTGGSQASGTPLQIWTCQSDNTNQKWFGTYASYKPPSNAVSFRLHSGTQDVTDRQLVVLAESATNNQPVVIDYEDLDNSNYDWVYNGSQLASSDGRQCLDVTDGVDADGTSLQVYQCTAGNTNQEWVFNADFTIQWKNHNKCVTLTDSKLAAGTPLQISTCYTRPNQQWRIAPVDE